MDNQPQLLQQSLALVGINADLKTTDLIYHVSTALIKNGEFGVKEAFNLKCEMEKKYEAPPESFEPKEVPNEQPDAFMEVMRDKVDESMKPLAVNNWREFVDRGYMVIGFLKGTELTHVAEGVEGMDSKYRHSLAPEGLDYDYCLLLHSIKGGGNISGHGKGVFTTMEEYWRYFDRDTFELVPPM